MAFDKVSKILLKIFGSRSERLVKSYMVIAEQAGEFEEQTKKLDNEALKAKTTELKGRIEEHIKERVSRILRQISDLELEFKDADVREKLSILKRIKRLKNKQFKIAGGVLMDMLPEAFAIVREASKRTVWHKTMEAPSDYYPELQERIRRAMNGKESLYDKDTKRAIELNLYSMRHFDVQLVGGKVLCEGKIAEMATGEGKTLAATLAAYLVHLTGRKIHIVTVNDYLAKRDAEWMAPVYKALGLSVGAIQAGMDTMGDERRAQYDCDVTYGTNNEFGFDYLRDNMKISLEQMVQGPLQFAIIDEVDSILVDEARTPLIISGPAFGHIKIEKYRRVDTVAKKLIDKHERELGRIGKVEYDEIELPTSRLGKLKQTLLARGLVAELETEIEQAEEQLARNEQQLEFSKAELAKAEEKEDAERVEEIQKRIDEIDEERGKIQQSINKIKIDALQAGGQITRYFEIDYKSKSVRLTERGLAVAQDIANVGSFYTGLNVDWPHLLEQSLRARLTFEKEKDYVVQEGKVLIVDEFTGRLMHGRQWSDGLHQAVEAKEGVSIKEETQTLGTITLQNFFKLYDNIAGMTGTAATEAEEFMNTYGLDVVVVPTNKTCIRDDLEDIIYKTMPEKINAIVEEINKVSATGQPILVGTTSVEKNEELVYAIAQKLLGLKSKLDGVEHQRREKGLEKLMDALRERLGLEVLNAKNHAREAHIIEQAGRQHKKQGGQVRGNITLTTNMAGRGTDIKLGPGVAEIGGLHVLGTERHEARRIDNQLRGRCGRQGDKGSSQFFLCFDDDLLKIFAPEWTVRALSWIGWEEGQPIIHKRISKGIEKAQVKVEQRNADIRHSLLEYDEVMDYQRRDLYSRRREILSRKDPSTLIQEMIHSTVTKYCDAFLEKQYAYRSLVEWVRSTFELDLRLSDVTGFDQEQAEDLEILIKEKAKEDAKSNISLSLGEYLHEPHDPDRWDIAGMCNWAAGVLDVSLHARDIKDQSADKIEEQLVNSVAKKIDDIDCSELEQFLHEDFAKKRLAEWAKTRFDIQLDIETLKTKSQSEICESLLEETSAKYKRREIEFPVEYAIASVYGKQDPNVYDFEWLTNWANEKYNAGLSVEEVQNTEGPALYKQLIESSEEYNNGRVDEEIDEQLGVLNVSDLGAWANKRFDASLTGDDLAEETGRAGRIKEVAREFLRRELSDCERAILISFYDNAWKEHLYAMDHLRNSVWMSSLEQKDPKIEYKREGSVMYKELRETLEDRISEVIFKVRGDSQMGMQSVWSVSQTAHDEVGQFAMTEQQRAAAQAPQGEVKVKQFQREGPKIGRNEPCPCKSGKKYKKCCMLRKR